MIRPAPDGHGIVFRRTDLPGRPSVEALWNHRVSQPLCTALRLPGGHLVRTVEHLLAALSALAIDDALIELDAEELPIFDGSATPWCERILAAGRSAGAAPRRYIRVLRRVVFEEGSKRLAIEPADTFTIDVRNELRHFGPMRWSGEVTPAAFVADIAPSRSFGRLKWAVPVKLYAFATGQPVLRGAHLRSTAAIWGGRIIGGARVPQEPVRHRALDLIGDLALAGAPILGHVTAINPGHEPNFGLLSGLLSDGGAWRYCAD